jgi:hypothetical protein
MYYNRVMMPAVDVGISMGEVMSWKLSGSGNLTKDVWAKKNPFKVIPLSYNGSTMVDAEGNMIKKSTITYLTGRNLQTCSQKYTPVFTWARCGCLITQSRTPCP